MLKTSLKIKYFSSQKILFYILLHIPVSNGSGQTYDVLSNVQGGIGMGCCTDTPVATAAETVLEEYSPFHNIVGLIVVLIVMVFLCGILNGGCGGVGRNY